MSPIITIPAEKRLLFCCPNESAAPSPVPPKRVVPTFDEEVGVEGVGWPRMLPDALVGELNPPLPPPPAPLALPPPPLWGLLTRDPPPIPLPAEPPGEAWLAKEDQDFLQVVILAYDIYNNT